MNYLKKFIIIVLVTITALACSVSPTGRSQLMLIPDSQMIVMGARAFEDTVNNTPVINHPEINLYVGCVVNAITRLPEVRKMNQKWEVVVFNDPAVNAFALPGGKIGINIGMLKFTATPGQLAAVIGHEVGHVMARHGNERVSQHFAVGETLKLMDNWLAENNKQYRATAMGLLGIGAQVGVLLPFNRVQESESDEIGQKLMAKAGFDPRDSARLWTKMQKREKGTNIELLSTHPSSKSRIEDLQSREKEALMIYKKHRANRAVCRIPNMTQYQ